MTKPTVGALVPQPPTKPIIGNLGDIDGSMPVQSFMKLARTYGPFFKMRFLDSEFYVASSRELVDELCDETRFTKRVGAALQEIRPVAGNGLFTADGKDPSWGKAHRILVPAFGPIAIRGMFDRMIDIADQMFTRWERFGPNAVIDVADNMTRLTLDTIALCAFDYRFNSFYQDQMHPFVAAMVGALKEAGDRSRRPRVMNSLMLTRARDFEANRNLMHSVARDLIAERRRDPRGNEKNDLLNLMLNGVDPVSGEKLDDENIIYQMITFLIAGHETTSGLLTFTTYLLIKNPEVLQKARAVVDEALGEEMPKVEHLARLHYLEQVLMESLRVWPTAAAFTIKPLEDTVLAGKYPLAKGDTVLILTPVLHRDPSVWKDAEAFRPERFDPEAARELPPNAWKPFGNGSRACIGRPFAMQEATLVLAMMLQRFDFVLDDPSYTLRIHETLTIKPENLRIRAKARRSGRSLVRSAVPATPARPLAPPPGMPSIPGQEATRLLILFGSNSGSAESFANRIAGDAPTQGFAPTVAAMDDYAGDLPAEGPVIVVTASYEGQPPDNARQFVAAIEARPEGSMKDVRFAVFGCGNRQWARTYQAVPKRVDAAFAKAGATRIAARGETDSGGDFFGAFDEWYAKLWPSLASALGREAAAPVAAGGLRVDFVKAGRESVLRLGELEQGTVIENRELVDMTASGARSKRHIEFQLPEGMTYRTGDYLVVLPRNPAGSVFRVMRRFGLSADTLMILSREGGSGTLPTDRPTVCGDLLAHYVELSQPATRAQVAALAASTRCPPDKVALEALASTEYETEVLKKRFSVLDLLDRFPACELPFAAFLDMLPPMRARQYSISSSPLWKADRVTLTVAVIDAPAFSGMGRFEGVSSSYLARLRPGDRVSIAVRPSNARFHPPDDPRTPIVMICAGSGIAPFRGFLQERAAQKAGGREVGPALLFFGTDHPDIDFLYREEFDAWERDGIATVLPAFSAKPDGDILFVQHRVWAERARVTEAFLKGGMIYVCGDGQRMAPAVREALIDIYREGTGASDADAHRWADLMEHERGRYVSDVFA